MKNTLYFFIFLLTSCSFKQTAKEAPATDSLIIILDTLVINNEVYYLDSIDAKEFESIYSLLNNETKSIVDYGYKQRNETIDDSIHVSRNSGTLTFHLKNGADSILTDIPCVTDDTVYNDMCENYEYVKSFDIIDYWLVRVDLWEGGHFLLVNKVNGEFTYIISEPLYSPNRKYFICYSCCLETGFCDTGIQLFEIKSKTVKELWYKELTEWGPSKIIWKNDSTIYMEQFRILENGYRLSYKSMTIIK